MKVITTEKIPIKMWLDHIEDGAMEQARNLANLPFAFKHVAIMPDAHLGYGMPIGGVVATKNVVVPNAVGVDIGCSVSAYKINLTTNDLPVEVIKHILDGIRRVVPFGEGNYPEADMELVEYLEKLEREIYE